MLNLIFVISMLLVAVLIAIAPSSNTPSIQPSLEVLYNGCVIKIQDRYTNLSQITEVRYNENITFNAGDFIVTYKVTPEQANDLINKFIECSNN